ncbi:hypothetical protein [Stieleria varia]|nr:hypothetical protein [Stieleria varia]
MDTFVTAIQNGDDATQAGQKLLAKLRKLDAEGQIQLPHTVASHFEDAVKLIEASSDSTTAAKAAKLRSLAPRGTVVRNALEAHELVLANDIVSKFGGNFVGAAKRGQAGFDGILDGVKVSLKETQGGLGAVLRHASQAESSALKAGVNVDLYIKAVNVGKDQLLDFAAKGPLSKIPTQGTISKIWVLTRDGWVQIVP